MEILHTNQNHQAMLLIKTAMATAVLVLPRINLTTTAVATKTTTKKRSRRCQICAAIDQQRGIGERRGRHHEGPVATVNYRHDIPMIQTSDMFGIVSTINEC